MDVIYWLIPLSIALLVIAIAIFFWAVRTGQFQDLDSPPVDILFDDDIKQQNNTNSKTIESDTDNVNRANEPSSPDDLHQIPEDR
ncbi:cbb3-type cytochrome oxidase assembly protein CcoS [Aliikangiella coralliicola]|uniref:Cbb3-type cytochrome oxidase assembly protein CcoS n=1 Tax=Aliikangiella coralliicola TaxID=2592383 RepID=A0A545UDJ2_9GAMM|nr:cbb3-type cytochrome oxidase assembly protein CcoS [Aliikangiella coralliicola]TQV87530.1 cbb3-type cytochrome oxidase assembly protein CcoS [Aliikangiella coralliicola]